MIKISDVKFHRRFYTNNNEIAHNQEYYMSLKSKSFIITAIIFGALFTSLIVPSPCYARTYITNVYQVYNRNNQQNIAHLQPVVQPVTPYYNNQSYQPFYSNNSNCHRATVYQPSANPYFNHNSSNPYFVR